MKKSATILAACLLFVLSFLGFSQISQATGFTVESGDTVVVNESVDGSLFVTGSNIVIEGDVEGTLFVAGETITIKGDINGAIFVAGNTIVIEGIVESEAFIAGNMIRTSESAEMKRDVFAAGNQVWIDGVIGRDLFVGSNSTHIQNQVGRDARIGTNTLYFDDVGQVNGDLFYQARQEVENIDEYVQGEVSYERQPVNQNRDMSRRSNLLFTTLRVVGTILSAVLIWTFLRGISHKRWLTISPQFINRPVLLTFIGLGIFPLFMVTIVLTLISIVLTNLGIFMLMIFFLLLFLGKIVAASTIGRYLIEHRLSFDKYNGLISFTIAYVLLYLSSLLPYVGWVISFLCIFYTMGLAFREIILRFQTKPV